MPSSLFAHDPPSLGVIQGHAANTSLGNRRFVARNFLLDENVSMDRAQRYHATVGNLSLTDVSQWQSRHWSYLSLDIYKGVGEGYRFGGTVDRIDTECPATFRDSFAQHDYGAADQQLQLLRVETAKGMATVIARNSGDSARIARELEDLARAAGPYGATDPVVAGTLDHELRAWGRSIDRRPVFVTWAGLFDGVLFEGDPNLDVPNWADELRDRLGLCHIEGGETLFVFRYAVADLPRFEDDPTVQPLAVPTVLDFGFYDAFCPAPRNRGAGHTVDLAARGYLQPEILHPGLRIQARHLFRVGRVTRPVPSDLTLARKEHFDALRPATGRPDYGVTTET